VVVDRRLSRVADQAEQGRTLTVQAVRVASDGAGSAFQSGLVGS
jgi:hypothetical protein